MILSSSYLHYLTFHQTLGTLTLGFNKITNVGAQYFIKMRQNNKVIVTLLSLYSHIFSVNAQTFRRLELLNNQIDADTMKILKILNMNSL